MNLQEYPQGIPECGSDALRFGLLVHVGAGKRLVHLDVHAPLALSLLPSPPLPPFVCCCCLLLLTHPGKDINLDVQRVAAYSKFCNKLWNATRFAFMYIGSGGHFTPGALPVSLLLHNPTGGPRTDLPCLPDAWILSRLAEAVEQVDTQLKNYQIAAAAETLYAFWYRELCDVYLEAIKPIMQLDSSSIANAATKHATQTVLHACLDYGLRLLHPFMPFVTEELYHRLQVQQQEEERQQSKSSCTAPPPSHPSLHPPPFSPP